ncbi:DUF488 family protein [Streptomyces sp. NA04227]|uniref:DUF488 domain-containing protein n=1 Tax=Streptomyces sp. NA04227 TaxID=2742136 RepID=UPI0015909B91|nr:DUF488 family protein [Streptomyces sp. NA04227]QKW05560.1 DUF488 family protein [Streptomyces sp. NA04227]
MADSADAAGTLHLGRIYDPVESGQGARILVDRLWPRGVSKEKAELDLWLRDVAPSGDLRTWYGHREARYEEFAERYRAELAEGPGAEALDRLAGYLEEGPVLLLTATKELDGSHLTVLAELLTGG